MWDDAEMLSEIDRIEALISPWLRAEESDAHAQAVAALRASIDGREQRLRDALADSGPEDADSLSAPLCFDDAGQLSGSFSVEWGGAGSQNATFSITLDGTSVPLSPASAYAGPDENVAGHSVLYLAAQTTDNRFTVAYVALPDELVQPGAIEAAGTEVESALIFFVEGTEEVDEVYFTSGTLQLDSGSASPGSVWQGTVTLRLWDPPWF
jgi:hypothetical protein